MKSYTAEELASLSREELLDIAKENLVNIAGLDKRIIEFTYDNRGLEGVFKLRYPSLMDSLRIGVAQAKLLDQTKGVDVTSQNIAFMYSTIKQVAIELPSWFELNKLSDYSVLEDIYTEYDTQVNAIRDSMG